MFFAKLLKVIAWIPSVVMGIESLHGANNGATKKSAAVDMVGTMVSISEAISQKDIVDDGAFKDGLNKAIDGVVQMLNASVWHKKA